MQEKRKPQTITIHPDQETWTKSSIKTYFEKTLAALPEDSSLNANQWLGVLIDQCVNEKAFHEAFTYFFEALKNMGLAIEGDHKQMELLASRIFYWQFVRRMIAGAGLMAYEDQIMRDEILKFYPHNQQPTPPPPPMHTKIVPMPMPYPQPQETSGGNKKSRTGTEPKHGANPDKRPVGRGNAPKDGGGKVRPPPAVPKGPADGG